MGTTHLKTYTNNKANGIKTDKYVGLTGGQIFHEMMREHEVKVIFGYSGGAILPVFDAIYQSKYFKFITPNHEQGAGHMAEGYARATGKPGIVIVTSGPGATNTVTAIQDANMDGTPMIVFCGQVATSAIGTDAFQEADITGITRPCTKWNVLVKNITELPRRINEAFHIATTGRPGPVVVDLPKDVTSSILNEPVSDAPYIPGHENHATSSNDDIQTAADLINRAKKPVLYVGKGVITANASDLIRAIAEKVNIPCTTTMQGLGAFDENSPLSLHMPGMHGTAYANLAIQNADLIIAVGARFDDRVTGRVDGFAPVARQAQIDGTGGIIHFDIAPEQIGKVVPTAVGVIGDARANLELLQPLIEERDHIDWIDQINRWKKQYPLSYKIDKRAGHIKVQAVVEELYRQTDGQAIVATGVGQHQMWAAQYYRYKYPRQWISSCGLATMGFGVPADIGAQIAHPDKTVVVLDGDGCFAMTGMEMATAARYGIKVKVIILNNKYQGMVRQWQDIFFKHRHSHTGLKNPDFVMLAQSLYCTGIRCEDPKDLQAKLKELLDCDGPAVLDIHIDPDENVYPMVGPGKTLNDMIFEDPTA